MSVLHQVRCRGTSDSQAQASSERRVRLHVRAAAITKAPTTSSATITESSQSYRTGPMEC